jgi:hypothetical protein
MVPYFVKWHPRHLLMLEKWNEVLDLIGDLNFIQEKAAAKLIYHLVEDFNLALQNISDNAENIRIESERHARMGKYTSDLIAYAKEEITRFEFAVPESITPWTQEKMDTEIEQIKINPTRLDKLKDFIKFLRH